MSIIKNPLITEKSLRLYEKEHKATFKVDINANKIDASKLLEKVYGVKVVSATVSNRIGKTKYNRLSKRFFYTGDSKIMFFKLEKDSNIEEFKTK